MRFKISMICYIAVCCLQERIIIALPFLVDRNSNFFLLTLFQDRTGGLIWDQPAVKNPLLLKIICFCPVGSDEILHTIHPTNLCRKSFQASASNRNNQDSFLNRKFQGQLRLLCHLMSAVYDSFIHIYCQQFDFHIHTRFLLLIFYFLFLPKRKQT